eukprot:43697_1
MTLSGAVHVYYIGLTLYSILTFILSCIVSIELWVYCHKLCSQKKLERIESNVSESKSGATLPDTSPSIQQTISNISGTKTYYLKPNYIFPLLSYLFYVGLSITGLMSGFSTDENICYWSIVFGTICYSLGKMWMYLVFIYRLHIAFMDSCYEYSWTLISGMMVCVIVYSISLMIINTLTLSTQIIHIAQNISICTSKLQFGIVEAAVCFDFIANAICCYLFTRPLILLSKLTKQNNNGGQTTGIYTVALKCIILTFTAVASTVIILAFVAVSGLTSFVTIDICINCVVIMLFKQEYSKEYKIICCGFIKLCSMWFHKKEKKTKSIDDTKKKQANNDKDGESNIS